MKLPFWWSVEKYIGKKKSGGTTKNHQHLRKVTVLKKERINKTANKRNLHIRTQN